MNGIYWFRNDLRLHDQPLLVEAVNECEKLALVYVFDPRAEVECEFGFTRLQSRRKRFLFQGVEALRKAIALRGGSLIIRIGSPEEIIPEIATALQVHTLYYSSENGTEERATARGLSERLPGIRIRTGDCGSLIHTDALPFSVRNTPEVFTSFRTAVEKNLKIASPVSEPDFKGAVHASSEDLPEIDLPQDDRSALYFEGGEHAARARLEDYFFKGDHLRSYKETRNGLLGANYSSKLSPWLAQGSLSPRLIYSEIKRYEEERIANDSTYWLLFELLWREFFRCIAQKHGAKLFLGLKTPLKSSRFDPELFSRWCSGETGMPFIDANMRELNATGYMSNRGRQNVASFLVHDLNLPWQAGAYYFEANLLDYDVASNWGNWAYVAGVGNDPRRDRYFNIVKQSENYDPKGDYIKLWCPELSHLSPPELFNPR